MNVTKPLVGIAALAIASGVALPTMAGSGNKYAAEESNRDCDNGSVQLVGPLKLWPPNHKMVAEPVTATADNSSDEVTITITPVITDATGGDGGAQHDPDFTPTDEDGNTVYGSGTGKATAAVELRAERSGKGTGRTYRLDWSAKFGNNPPCNSSTADDENAQNDPFVITVPHDMRTENR